MLPTETCIDKLKKKHGKKTPRCSERYCTVGGAHTQSEVLQRCSIEHYKTTTSKEFLMGEIDNIVWFIDSGELHT